jgi:hypothetical protein
MNKFWSKDDFIKRKNDKTSARILSSRTLIFYKLSLVMAILTFSISFLSMTNYTITQQNVNYKISFLNGKIQDYKEE